jgi:hypothetical protein
MPSNSFEMIHLDINNVNETLEPNELVDIDIDNQMTREEQVIDQIESDLCRLAQTISSEISCSICMSEMTYADLSSDHLKFTTRCGHAFCIKCISQWIFTKVTETRYNQTIDCHCPMCRTVFYTFYR